MVQNKKSKLSLIVLLILLLFFAALICFFFATRMRFPENSKICGIDTSDMLVEDVRELLQERVSNYSMKISAADQVFEITADDIGLVFLIDEFESVVASAIEMGTEVEPLSVICVDQEKLDSYIALNFDQKKKESQLATVVWDDSKGHYKVIEGAAETWYDAEVLVELIYNSVLSLDEELEVPVQLLYKELDNSDQYSQAEELAVRANTLLELNLEYVFNPRKVELGRHVIDGDVIASFLRVDTVSDSIEVDQNAVLTYVENISDGYDYFLHKDRFVTHDGDRIDVKIPFQAQTVDTQSFVSLISENILNGTSGTFEVPYSGAVNFEGSYVEVSIPQQHLWVYIDGKMVLESDVVTGNESLGKLTPTGLNYVRGHLRDIELFGDYFVNYWMAITKGGRYGFHDADGWRTLEEYGGDTYKTNGSGGCVNMPREKIAIMYDLVPDGTPVVIYNAYFYD